MKKMWNSFKIAFALYSRLPMPNIQWTEENMSYVMCFFPWIGCVIGALTWGVFWLEDWALNMKLGFSPLFYTILLVLIPFLVTGGIHMDGFLDTMDALSSYQSRERRLEILKDPHAGAFAIISGLMYMLMYIGIYTSLSRESVLAIALSFMLSRTLSAISVLTFPQARSRGMVADVSKHTRRNRVLRVLKLYLLGCFVMLVFVGKIQGLAVCVAAGLIFVYYRRMSKEKFGGVTGDLAGYFLQLCELGMAGAAVIADIIWKGMGGCF